MPSEKVVGVLDRLGVEVPSDEFGHYGVKGMKWDKNLTPEEREKKRLELLAKAAEQTTNQNNKALAFLKENNLFDKKVLYLQQTGAKYVKNARGGKELVFTGAKARTAVKQGKLNRLIEDIFNGKKKTKKDPALSKNPVIKSIGPTSVKVKG